jgi:hypothetical protein
MKNELSKIDPEAAKFLAVAQNIQAGANPRLIKFIKGDYFMGEENVSGKQYIAHIKQLARGWVKFSGGECVERRISKVEDGFEIPPRAELDDLDDSQWEKDGSGHPRDPWVKQYFLPLEDFDTAALAIFVTGSQGGLEAIARLCQLYARDWSKGLPMIDLATASYKHKRHGRIETPDLRVIGWQPPPGALGNDPSSNGPDPNPSAEIPY